MHTSFKAQREDLARAQFPPSTPHKLESLRGPGFSSVVIRDFCLAGPHPGQTTAEVTTNLTPLLRAGVTCFVCLQHDLPRAGVAQSRSTYGGGAVVTARPYIQDAQALVDGGAFPQRGSGPLNFIHVPISDANGATVPDDVLKPLLLDLIAFMRAGEYLYIQCSEGNGRTGTVVACLLGLAHGLASSQALDLAQRIRNDRAGAAGTWPETHEQKMQVHRILTDAALRAAVAAAAPRRGNTSAVEDAERLAGVLKKARTVLARNGHTSLIYLRGYATKLAGGRHDGSLTQAAFAKLHADGQWFLTADEAAAMWRGALAAVAPGEGGAGEAGVPVPALFRLLRGSMPARRAAVVHDAFRALSGGSGSATMARIASAFKPTGHPDVRSAKRTREAVQAEFYSTFGIAGSGPAAVLSGATLPVPPSAGTTPSGSGGGSSAVVVPAEDWEDYFAHVSAACGDDGIFFEQLVTGCFPAPQGAGAVLEPGASLAADGSVWRPSVLQAIAQLQQAAAAPGAARAAPGGSSHSGHGGSAGVRRTEHGYTYADTADPGVNVAALREHLRRCGAWATSKASPVALTASAAPGASVALASRLLGLMSRAADPSSVGCCDFALAQLAATLRGADSSRSGFVSLPEFRAALGAAGAPLPDDDAEAAFAALGGSKGGRIPIEEAHATLRFAGAMPEPRRALVCKVFADLDSAGAGAIPIAALAAAFSADAHPSVVAGRAAGPALQRAFVSSFVDGFELADRWGPSARASGGPGSPAARAYSGSGDGRVRLGFFLAWHEAVSAAVPDDAAFSLFAFHCWSAGGAGGRIARGRVPPPSPAAAAAALATSEGIGGGDGLLGNMTRLAVAPEPHSRGAGIANLGSSLAPPSAEAPHGGLQHAPAPGSFYEGGAYSQGYGSHAFVASRRTGPSGAPVASAQATGLALRQQQQQGSPAAAGGAFSAPAVPIHDAASAGGAGGYREPPPSGDAALDGVLAAMRAVLARRGPKALFRLVQELAAAAAPPAPAYGAYGVPPSGPAPGALLRPLPMASLAAVLADESFGLAPAQLDVLASRLGEGSGGGGGVVPAQLLQLLHGPLPASRTEVVGQAFDRVLKRAGLPRGAASAPLEEVVVAFRSKAHPDVRAGRRAEDAVLRDFMETFRGEPFVVASPGGGGGGGGSVTAGGFAAYYTALSLFIPHDMHFSNLLFDVWGLYDGPLAGDVHAASSGSSDAVSSPSAGRATQGYAPPPGHHSQLHAFTSGRVPIPAPWAQASGPEAAADSTYYRRSSTVQQATTPQGLRAAGGRYAGR